MAHKDILINRQFGEKRQFLIDYGNTFCFTVCDALELLDLSVIDDVAGVSSVLPDS